MQNKTIIGTIIGLLLGVGSTTLLGGTVPIDESKQSILADNVEQHTRLKQPPVWDTSIVSSKEITQAYIDIGNKYGVTEKDITDSGGNLQTAIQTKMAEQFLLCDNPTTNKI